jgi:hypothetical protein
MKKRREDSAKLLDEYELKMVKLTLGMWVYQSTYSPTQIRGVCTLL